MAEEIFLGRVHRDVLHSAIKEKELAIRKILPEKWTHGSKINVLMIGYHLKLLGFNWSNNDQYAFFMGQLADLKILEQNGEMLRLSPLPIYQKEKVQMVEEVKPSIIYLGCSGWTPITKTS